MKNKLAKQDLATIKAILIMVFGILLAVILTRFLGFYQLQKGNLSWGITVHYNYYIFGFIYLVASILSLSLKKERSLWINSFLFLIYSYLWHLSFPEYPIRVFAIFLSSLSIYALGQFLIIRSNTSASKFKSKRIK